MKRKIQHVPVMLEAVLGVLNLRPGMVVVDCTLGLGGHSSAMLERVAPGGRGGKLIATDFDFRNIEIARGKLTKLGKIGETVFIFQTNFAALPSVLLQVGVEKVDAVLADLGVSSPQIDDEARGFSYRRAGPLDMRMDPRRGQSAADLLARISEKELAASLLEFGDEEDAVKVARAIVEERAERPILTTEHLARIVSHARDFTVTRAAGAKLHPAARTFQALRIMVNRELANLDRLLAVLPAVLKPGGVAAIISFHSGEDRRVKYAFRDGAREGTYADWSPEPVVATKEEIEANPRSRSAKLRWARRA